jgi:hypothetical protein
LCNKPFCNGPGNTQKAIAGCCIDSAGITGSAAVIQLIICDAVCQKLGSGVQLKAEIPKVCELPENIQSLFTLFHTEDALQTDNAACPGSWFNRIPVTAIGGNAFPKGGASGKSRPVANKPLARRQMITHKLDPTVFPKTNHFYLLDNYIHYR